MLLKKIKGGGRWQEEGPERWPGPGARTQAQRSQLTCRGGHTGDSWYLQTCGALWASGVGEELRPVLLWGCVWLFWPYRGDCPHFAGGDIESQKGPSGPGLDSGLTFKMSDSEFPEGLWGPDGSRPLVAPQLLQHVRRQFPHFLSCCVTFGTVLPSLGLRFFAGDGEMAQDSP